MNEQIVKLFVQSVDSNYIPVPVEDHIPSWTEKFAELIVRECVGIVDDEGCGEGGSIRAMKKIKEHFGVEE